MTAFLRPLPNLPIRNHRELDPGPLGLLDHVESSLAAWKRDDVVHSREL